MSHRERVAKAGVAIAAVAVIGTAMNSHAKSEEQVSYETGVPVVAAMVGSVAAVAAAGNVYTIRAGTRHVGWVVAGFIGTGWCAYLGLGSLMFGEVGARYAAGFMTAAAGLGTVTIMNLRLPRPPEPPRELAEPEAMLVPTVLPGASTMVPGLALTATW